MGVGIKVGDLMRKSVVVVKPSDSAEKALKQMIAMDIGSVVVFDNNTAVGIVTDSDLLERVYAKRKDDRKVKIRGIMSSPVRSVSPETDVEKCAELMRDHRVKRMPVVSKGKLVGIISELDIAYASPAIFDILKERPRMLEGTSETMVSGICESCGEYSEKLRMQESELVCEECKEEE